MTEFWPWLRSLFDNWVKQVTSGAITALLALAAIFYHLPRWIPLAWFIGALFVASYYSWRAERRARLTTNTDTGQRIVYIESTRSLLQRLRLRLGDMRAELQQHRGTSSATNHAAGVDQILTAIFDPVRTAAIGDSGLESLVHDRATRVAAMLSSHEWDFNPSRPGGFYQRGINQITQLQGLIYDTHEQLGALITRLQGEAPHR